MNLKRFSACVLIYGGAAAAILGGGAARAQDMEPRAFSASPIDTNFLIASYARVTGAVSIDPALEITNVKASVNTALFAYDRTFDLFGQTASATVLLPYFQANVSGDVMQSSKQVTRAGQGDLRIRFTENLIGNQAMTPAEFAQRTPETTLGLAFTITAPTGDYDSTHLVNISSHRWAFKPEIGAAQPFGNWFVDGAVGAWVFTNNTSFFGGHERGELPLWVLQAHGGYYFEPGLWLAADLTHYFGGDTVLDGVNKHDFQSVTRFGATLSLPLGSGFSAKAAWSSWLVAHNGGAFDTLSFALQYRWFDP